MGQNRLTGHRRRFLRAASKGSELRDIFRLHPRPVMSGERHH